MEIADNKVVLTHEDGCMVQLERGQRGGYAWTLKKYGKDFDSLIDAEFQADQRLRQLFGSNGNAKES